MMHYSHIFLLPTLLFTLAHTAPTPNLQQPSDDSLPQQQPSNDNTFSNPYEIAPSTNPQDYEIASNPQQETSQPQSQPSPSSSSSSSPNQNTPTTNINPPCRPGSFHCSAKTPNTPQLLLNAKGVWLADGTSSIAYTNSAGQVQSQASAVKICDDARYMEASPELQASHCRLCLTSNNNYCVLWKGRAA